MSNYLVLLVILPLLGAFLMQPLSQLLGSKQAGRKILQNFGRAVIAVTLTITYIVATEGEGVLQLPLSLLMGGFVVPVGINLYLDQFSLLWLVAIQVSLLILWPASRDIRQHLLLLVVAASSMGMALSGDLFNIYVFYELLAVATFGLVAQAPHPAAAVVSFRYLLLSAFGSVLALAGIAIIYSQSGSLNLAHLSAFVVNGETQFPLAAFLLLLVGFGVKAELFGVNGWVPEVYGVVSSRMSALLAGVISKIAVVVIVRIMLLLFPYPEASQALLVLGILGMVGGEWVAWHTAQRGGKLSTTLAYSSIGQLGMIFVAFSFSLTLGLFVGVALALHHLIVKSGLFMLSSAQLNRWQLGLFVLFGLSLIGVPPLPGFWIKLAMLQDLWATGGGLEQLAIALFLLATVVEASYLSKIISTQMVSPQFKSAKLGGNSEERRNLNLAWLYGILLFGAIFFINPLAETLHGIAVQTEDGELLRSVVLENSIDPLAGGEQ
ncbi:MAG: NADH-quinone oxidoreductase subunit J [Thiotrichales bacterium]|jgi:formate hydrogenlyase subunit 3/multisubunit Na+/H+ antiporter MnhD subunit|nr:NADH-quinone oxidoreductase subunit J [Thiotrichales bacterium]MBT4151939.1 NADH-quinone oxidoreductase subunit J [Thiotrichales bacterium]MBT4260934.1 NADH-quinone oxidoreductase subunit J [Thiotrichales bacterium]MBT4573946.1 NADH-quinone oxidoreductase subunit J [Thiotrichales bacterium]MBT4971174.1 NADH-quinone oxidoreductase subunit J [Thiotrichales bacterium]